MKFFGTVGYCSMINSAPGVWREEIIERQYYGDILNNVRTLQGTSSNINADVNFPGKISIVADPFANENFLDMRYVEHLGAKWRIERAEIMYPRIILTIGGLYNENES